MAYMLFAGFPFLNLSVAVDEVLAAGMAGDKDGGDATDSNP